MIAGLINNDSIMKNEPSNQPLTQLNELLTSLETSDDLREESADRLRNRPEITEAVRFGLPADQPHLSLDALRHLVRERQQNGEQWQMPDHLANCSLCLDAFEAMLEGLPELRSDTWIRYERLYRKTEGMTLHPLPLLQLPWLRIAAILIIGLGLAFAFQQFNPRATATIQAGACLLQNGSLLATGAILPSHQMVMAQEETSATLEDGSTIKMDKETRFSFGRSWKGNITVSLQRGQMTVSVTKRKQGRLFIVRTSLGNIRVMGTRFSVKADSEPVIVFENRGETNGQRRYATAVSMVIIHVEEGLVTVNNRYEQVKVSAGQTAILRKGQPMIELR